jgi:hypothetical protein
VAVSATIETDDGRVCATGCPDWALEPVIVIRRVDD